MDSEGSRSVAGYRLVAAITDDGFGRVVVAEPNGGSRRVLLREFRVPDIADFPVRLQTTANTLRSLASRGFPVFLDCGVNDGRAWLTSPYIDGRLLTPGRHADDETLRILTSVAGMLQSAHQLGLVHADIGPNQILLPTGGGVAAVVLNLGMSALVPRTLLNPLTGTPAYTAPEIIRGNSYGPPADQYSLACVAYEMLSGTTPFDAPPAAGVSVGRGGRSLVPLSARRPDLARVDPVIARALATDPAHRYPGCPEFVSALGVALQTPAATIPPPAPATLAPLAPETTVRGATAQPGGSAGMPPAPPIAEPPVGGADAPDHPPTPSRRRRTLRNIAIAAAALMAVVGVSVAATLLVLNARSTDPAQTLTSTVSAGYNTTCAIHDRSAFCWGDNSRGQIGDGTTLDRTSPTKVTGLGEVTSIVVSWESVCAISDGALFCWGDNDSGQLGDGTTEQRSTPTRVPGLTGVTSVDIGAQASLVDNAVQRASTACAVADGGAYCWGSNRNGQLGDGTNTDKTKPTRVRNLSDPTKVVTDTSMSCALTKVGDVLCWGQNSRGELADGTLTSRTEPVRVAGLQPASDLDTKVGTTCALTDGGLWCWGINRYGQLGDGTTLPSTVPTQVDGLPAVSAFGVGAQAVCAVAGDSTYCWGLNSSKFAAAENSPGYVVEPTKVDALSGGVRAVAVGSGIGCAEKADSLVCWGDNSSGQLGIGSTDFVAQPTEVNF